MASQSRWLARVKAAFPDPDRYQQSSVWPSRGYKEETRLVLDLQRIRIAISVSPIERFSRKIHSFGFQGLVFMLDDLRTSNPGSFFRLPLDTSCHKPARCTCSPIWWRGETPALAGWGPYRRCCLLCFSRTLDMALLLRRRVSIPPRFRCRVLFYSCSFDAAFDYYRQM